MSDYSVINEFHHGSAKVSRDVRFCKFTSACVELSRGTKSLYEFLHNISCRDSNFYDEYLYIPSTVEDTSQYPQLLQLFCQECMLRSYQLDEYYARVFIPEVQSEFKFLKSAAASNDIITFDATLTRRFIGLFHTFQKCFYVEAPVPVFFAVLCAVCDAEIDSVFVMPSGCITNFSAYVSKLNWDAVFGCFQTSRIFNTWSATKCSQWFHEHSSLQHKDGMAQYASMLKDPKVKSLVEAYCYAEYAVR